MSSSLKINSPLVGIIANTLTPDHRALVVLEIGQANNDGFFPPLNFSFKDAAGGKIFGEVILLDMLTAEAGIKQGISQGRQYLEAVVEYFSDRNMKVVAFTSATKRLPENRGGLFKEKYPDLTFTIGDNGTLLSFLRLVDHVFSLAGSCEDKIVVMGAGFLGEAVIDHLLVKGCKNIIVFSSQRLDLPDSVKVIDDFSAIGKGVKMFISCTHRYRDSIDPLIFRNILADQAVILDVAIPPGIDERLTRALAPSIRRFSAGDFFLPSLAYDFPPALLQFPAVGLWYGCFTEAIMLGLARKAGEDLSGHDFFQVNKENIALVDRQLNLNKGVIQIPFIDLLNDNQPVLMKPY